MVIDQAFLEKIERAQSKLKDKVSDIETSEEHQAAVKIQKVHRGKKGRKKAKKAKKAKKQADAEVRGPHNRSAVPHNTLNRLATVIPISGCCRRCRSKTGVKIAPSCAGGRRRDVTGNEWVGVSSAQSICVTYVRTDSETVPRVRKAL